jgi:hypothetical protein
MDPHSSKVSGKEVFPEYGWEEIGWHHESWKWKRNLELMNGALIKSRRLFPYKSQIFIHLFFGDAMS